MSYHSFEATQKSLHRAPRLESVRWSLGSDTRCGQKGYLRPCQTQDCSRIPATLYPLADICKSEREMVFVVDDDAALRESIVEVVSSLGFSVTGCGSASELQELAPQQHTGCILLDIRLPGQDGLAVHDWLKVSGIRLPVIFISGQADVGTAVHCMKAGAVEFLVKPFGEMQLRRSVSDAVALSRKQFCRSESEDLVRNLVSSLTPSEKVVANLIAKGLTTKMIAAELERSENTIKIHRHRIFTKLMVGSAASLANIIHYCQIGEG